MRPKCVTKRQWTRPSHKSGWIVTVDLRSQARAAVRNTCRKPSRLGLRCRSERVRGRPAEPPPVKVMATDEGCRGQGCRAYDPPLRCRIEPFVDQGGEAGHHRSIH